MITLTLQDDTILRFNLKQPLKESILRDAWYSMQDVAKAQENKLVIKTDKDISYKYIVKEIKNCVYDPKTFLYDIPAVEKHPIKKPEVLKTSVTSTPKSSILNSVTSNPDVFGQAIEKIMEGLQLIFESIPDKYKMNLQIFTDRLHEEGIPLEPFSQESMMVVSEAMTCEEFQLEQYIEKYKELWNKFKRGI